MCCFSLNWTWVRKTRKQGRDCKIGIRVANPASLSISSWRGLGRTDQTSPGGDSSPSSRGRNDRHVEKHLPFFSSPHIRFLHPGKLWSLGWEREHLQPVFTENPPANAGDAGDKGSIPGLGRSPGGGNGLWEGSVHRWVNWPHQHFKNIF